MGNGVQRSREDGNGERQRPFAALRVTPGEYGADRLELPSRLDWAQGMGKQKK